MSSYPSSLMLRNPVAEVEYRLTLVEPDEREVGVAHFAERVVCDVMEAVFFQALAVRPASSASWDALRAIVTVDGETVIQGAAAPLMTPRPTESLFSAHDDKGDVVGVFLPNGSIVKGSFSGGGAGSARLVMALYRVK